MGSGSYIKVRDDGVVEPSWFNLPHEYKPTVNDIRGLFRGLQQEYGQCIGTIRKNDGAGIGWAFKKRIGDYVLWAYITVHTGPFIPGGRYSYKEL